MAKTPYSSKGTPNPNGEGDDAKKQLRKISGELHVRGDIEAQLPQEFIEEYATSNRKSERRENKRLVVEFVTLGFVAIVAVLSLIQSCQSIKSADAAKRAADTARDALVNGQRAVVSAEMFTVARQHGKDGKIDALQFTVGWKNSGQTTTKNLETWSNWRLAPPETRVDKTFDFTDTWMPSGRAVLHEKGFAATQALRNYYPMTVQRPIVEAVAQGKIDLIFWGRATYQDVFSNVVHTSEYCLTVVGFDGDDPFDIRPEGTTYPRFISCPVHNCQDDECKVN